MNAKFVDRINRLEEGINIAGLTQRYGIHSFKHEKSSFIDVIAENISLQESDIFYDLGSGYGFLLLKLADKFPESKFKGIEIVEERANFSKELLTHHSITNCEIIGADMLEFDFMEGTYFFLFNPLHDYQYPIIIEKLGSIQHDIVVITEAKACYFFKKVPWLKPTYRLNLDYMRVLQIFRSRSK